MNEQTYEKLTSGIIAALEEAIATGGVAPWQKPWLGIQASNPVTKTVYSGVNRLVLEWSGRADPRWLTFKQAQALKGQVKKGAKGVPVCYYASYTKLADRVDEETGETIQRRRDGSILKFYYVFNVEDIEGLDLPPLVRADADVPPIERCEAIIAGYSGPSISHGGGRAFYSPALDHVQVPTRGSFEAPEAYYGVLFHECVHSTGHSSRLDRFGKTGEPARFGDADYSREELVAELGSYFLAAEAGIGAPIQENQAAYLGSWLRVLKADPKVLIGSAAAAQKAVDLILGRT